MQLEFFRTTAPRVVNVASVPQRSPFRYPGGKTWLVPRIREWLQSQPAPPRELIEPFAGGGSVSLTAGFEELVEHVTMVEMDAEVAAVWQTIINGDAAGLARQIRSFDLSVDSMRAVLEQEPRTVQDRAFQTMLKNRTYHGGILAAGSGILKYGENGKGIRSRWYPETLERRILAIAAIRERFSFIQGDGIEVMRQYASQPDAVFFIDPPYTAAGKKAGRRLYTHNQLDHEELFRVTASLAGDFLMTYDNAEGVKELAERHGFDTELVPMQNTHLTKMTELLIGRNLDWVRTWS